MKNIMVAIDFESGALELLRQAETLAKGLEAKIWLIHVAAPDPDFVGLDAGPQTVRDQRADELHDEHQKIQTWADQLAKKGIEAEALLVQGSTVKTIKQKQEELNIDLLVIGSHQHGWLFQTLLGSTRDELLKNHEIPVLLVPMPN